MTVLLVSDYLGHILSLSSVCPLSKPPVVYHIIISSLHCRPASCPVAHPFDHTCAASQYPLHFDLHLSVASLIALPLSMYDCITTTLSPPPGSLSAPPRFSLCPCRVAAPSGGSPIVSRHLFTVCARTPRAVEHPSHAIQHSTILSLDLSPSSTPRPNLSPHGSSK